MVRRLDRAPRVPATARDLLANALHELDQAGFEIVLHVHDEVVAEIDAGAGADVAEAFKRCMLDAPAWAAGLPLAAEVRTGQRYIKTSAKAEDVVVDPVEDVAADPIDDVTADPVDDDGAAEFADPFLAALDAMNAEEGLAQAGVPPFLATLKYHGSSDLPGEPGDGIDLADLIGNVPGDRKIPCPFHADRSPSLHVYTDHYYCFGCGAHGDRAGWLMRAGGLDYVEALHVLGAWDGVAVPGPGTIADGGTSKAPDPERTTYALRWWNEAQTIAGTLAARYLGDVRGIDLAALPDDIGERALRFHPNCVFGFGVWHPCLLALMRDPISGKPTGIQRTALTIRRPEDRPHDARSGRRGADLAGRQFARDRRGARDHARRRHSARLSRRTLCGPLGPRSRMARCRASR